jgi:hypothetical protein
MGFDDFEEFDEETVEDIAAYLIANGGMVQEWLSVKDHTPKEPGEYNIAQKHWLDGHLEAKKGTWNGVEWFVDGRESLMVAYWIPPLPLPELPKGE